MGSHHQSYSYNTYVVIIITGDEWEKNQGIKGTIVIVFFFFFVLAVVDAIIVIVDDVVKGNNQCRNKIIAV